MKQTTNATITTAVKLTKKQVSLVIKTLEKKYSAVELKQVVDKTIIAGVKLTVGSQEIDATAYTKLEKLHNQLKTNS